METPTQPLFVIDNQYTNQSQQPASPRTPTNANIVFVVPDAPKKTYYSRSRVNMDEYQVPEGFVYHPILRRRGLPPIRKIVF